MLHFETVLKFQIGEHLAISFCKILVYIPMLFAYHLNLQLCYIISRVLLVNEMDVKRKQHRGLLIALELSMTQRLLDPSTVSWTMQNRRMGGTQCG
jgi:hypothetical protein